VLAEREWVDGRFRDDAWVAAKRVERAATIVMM